ncbi:MAG: hypothetical protein ACYTG7_20205, partial [Planctomycetota bacterium]
MNRFFQLLLLLTLLGLVTACTASPRGDEHTSSKTGRPLLLKNLHVFDVFNGTMEGPKDILIEGNLIQTILEPGEYAEIVQRIDCKNGFALPGLFDCHTHIVNLTLEEDDKCEEKLRAFVSSGITQVRDVGGPIDLLHDMNRRILNGEL